MGKNTYLELHRHSGFTTLTQSDGGWRKVLSLWGGSRWCSVWVVPWNSATSRVITGNSRSTSHPSITPLSIQCTHFHASSTILQLLFMLSLPCVFINRLGLTPTGLWPATNMIPSLSPWLTCDPVWHCCGLRRWQAPVPLIKPSDTTHYRLSTVLRHWLLQEHQLICVSTVMFLFLESFF